MYFFPNYCHNNTEVRHHFCSFKQIKGSMFQTVTMMLYFSHIKRALNTICCLDEKAQFITKIK